MTDSNRCPLCRMPLGPTNDPNVTFAVELVEIGPPGSKQLAEYYGRYFHPSCVPSGWREKPKP